MQLRRLSLMNFRNYESAEITFGDGIHIIHGPNGAGKTSVLEAIHYLALTRSFRTTIDRHLLRNQSDMFRLQGNFVDSQGQTIQSIIAYTVQGGKRLTVNQEQIPRFSEYIGEVPVVLLHPADLSLSQGSPQERRRFLDVLLSQSNRLYLHHLIQYNRSLKQRNLLLQQENSDLGVLMSWEENLITHGSELLRRRFRAVAELDTAVKAFYRELSRGEERVKMIYRSSVSDAADETLETNYRNRFAGRREREKEYGTTVVGPHRDDILFLINGKPMKTVASQGEHKTFVIALKLAEFQHLRRERLQAPILLFDDIFGELDGGRISRLLRQLGEIGQVFVTTTSPSFFDKVAEPGIQTQYYAVANGTVQAA